jgi:5-(hydroxymethyl)furfural/furfural oxidase
MKAHAAIRGSLPARFDVVVIGAGSAGCVIANRLSADGRTTVCLIEAGKDLPPGEEPADILDTYAGNAYVNAAYRWDNILVSLSGQRPNTARKRPYEQARIMGGNSSINGQVAVRGSEADYDAWAALGAEGWAWKDVEPFFRRLEKDLDFVSAAHGDSGAISIRRIFPKQWDPLSIAAGEAMRAGGFNYIEDLNGPYAEGYGPLPLSNAGGRRVSAAMGYLDNAVRRRPNLTILTQTRVRKILFDDSAASGVEVDAGKTRETINASHVVVAAGVMNSPKLLMLSGVGEADHLRQFSIPVVADLRGVGQNLQDHPAVSFSAYLPSWARFNPVIRRHSYVNLRYSSRVAGCPDVDMIMNPVSRSAWHPLGWRLATFQIFIGKPFSRGRLRLASAVLDDSVNVDMNFLSDDRDCVRLMHGVKLGAKLLGEKKLSEVALDPFPSAYSTTVQKIGAKTFLNKLTTAAGAILLEGPRPLRRAFIHAAITGGETLQGLVSDDRKLENYVRNNVSVGWHACGTCRMGANDDTSAVVAPAGEVRTLRGLWVGDSSVMPEIPRSNINIPTIMVGEKISDHIAAALRKRRAA